MRIMKKVVIIVLIVASVFSCKTKTFADKNTGIKEVLPGADFEYEWKSTKYSVKIDSFGIKNSDSLVDPGFEQEFRVQVFENSKKVKDLSFISGQIKIFGIQNRLMFELFKKFPATGYQGFYELINCNGALVAASNEPDQLIELTDKNEEVRFLSLAHYTRENLVKKFSAKDDLYERKGGVIIYSTIDSIIDIVDIYYEDSEFSSPVLSIDPASVSAKINRGAFITKIELNSEYAGYDFVPVFIGTREYIIDTVFLGQNKIFFDNSDGKEEFRFTTRFNQNSF